jgi:hypothetical protein
LERTANLNLVHWRNEAGKARIGSRAFAGMLVVCALGSALLASWIPLQFSIVTVFLFAGPHNWFELRYFLTRLPVRFGRSRTFFLTAFAGIGLLTIAYLALPLLYYANVWSGANWPSAIATWNTLLLLWLATLVWLRNRQKKNPKWALAWPLSFAFIGFNWLGPELFSLAIVYAHPLVALWFLDRHLRRTRPDLLRIYHRGLLLVPVLMGIIFWKMIGTAPLPDDNGLAWRITQHAGAELLPNVSTHLLVSMHVFLEMLHYAVWLLALPLIAASSRKQTNTNRQRTFWSASAIPLARHPRGFPRLVMAVLAAGIFVVLLLWLGFSVDYAATRDIYFAVAIAHVLAEAPFLMRML